LSWLVAAAWPPRSAASTRGEWSTAEGLPLRAARLRTIASMDRLRDALSPPMAVAREHPRAAGANFSGGVVCDVDGGGGSIRPRRLTRLLPRNISCSGLMRSGAPLRGTAVGTSPRAVGRGRCVAAEELLLEAVSCGRRHRLHDWDARPRVVGCGTSVSGLEYGLKWAAIFLRQQHASPFAACDMR
jgi:hypothetical protein